MRICPKCGAKYGFDVSLCVRDGTPLTGGGREALAPATIGDWIPLELIGTGGMAQVFRARHAHRPGRYALKVLSDFADDDGTTRERFDREAEAIKRISHENVVSMIDFGTTPSGRRFLVMEWVEGMGLNELIKREAPFSALRAASFARQLAYGLAAIHDAGFVHRDMKPHNAITSEVRGVETVKIVDFGLVYADPRLWERLTRCGDIVGTPYYMSPETIDGLEVDARTDLYSLGVMIYEMLAGRPPFTSTMIPEILAMHLRERPRPLPDCGGLESLVAALLEKRPEDRPASADEVIAMLEDLDLTTTGSLSPRAASVLTMKSTPEVLEVERPVLDFEPETDFEATPGALGPGTLGGADDPRHLLPTRPGPDQSGTPMTRPALEKTGDYPAPIATLIVPSPRGGPAPTHTRVTTEVSPPVGEDTELDDQPEQLETAILGPDGSMPSLGIGSVIPEDPGEESSGLDAHTFVDSLLPDPRLDATDPGDDTPALTSDALATDAPPLATVTVLAGQLGLPGAAAGSPSPAPASPAVPAPDGGKREPSATAPSSSAHGAVLVVGLPSRSGPVRPGDDTILAAPGPSLAPASAATPGASRSYGAPPRDATSPRRTTSPAVAAVPVPLSAHRGLAFTLVLLVVAGAGLGYLLKARSTPDSVVQIPVPPRGRAAPPEGPPAEGPKAIARPPTEEEPTPTKPAEAPAGTRSIAELERELRRAAHERGFAPDDLAGVSGLERPYSEWLEAKRAADAARAQAAVGALETGLADRAPDPALLHKRSDELAVLLRAARDDIPVARLRILETRHLELSDRIERAPSPEALRIIGKALRKLRSEVELARKSGRAEPND